MYRYKNIIFRKVEETDLKILKEIKDDSWYSMHSLFISNMRDQKQWFENTKDILFIIETGNAKIIGYYFITNIDLINRKYSFSYAVCNAERKKGYGKLIIEAGNSFGFNYFNMNRIECEVLESNKISLKILKSVGFIEEGIKRKCIYKNNQYINSIILAILKDENK